MHKNFKFLKFVLPILSNKYYFLFVCAYNIHGIVVLLSIICEGRSMNV